jgi:outer membrane lipoprotein-sorting protein
VNPPILQRHPALRWLAPVGVACVAGLAATGFFSSAARSHHESLPATTPAALIAAVQQPRVEGFSGLAVTHVSLGLPEVPGLAGAESSTTFAALLSGAHTLQVWYGGATRQRIALLGSTDETDVFRDGSDVWEWRSDDRSAVHAVMPARAGAGPVLPATVSDLTPIEFAQRLLSAMEPSTQVRVADHREVADRSAYDLVLTPRDAGTKIGQVRIAVDGQTKVPLGVQVTARGSSAPAIDITFTKIRFARQPDRAFRFTPPGDATVHRVAARDHQNPAVKRAGAVEPGRTVTGRGWSAVLTAHPPARALAALRSKQVTSALTPVSGSWGRGYLLDSDLVSALITSDGRVLVGAVPASSLYAAAGRK